jgi:enoyl-CoA hydratase/3-hydroxyacyl-CoA dehydrogenase
MEVGADGVAVITLQNGKVNALHPTGQIAHARRTLQLYRVFLQDTDASFSHAVIKQLFDNLQKAHSSPQVRAIVITGANGTFSGGFDISQFKSGGADANLSENVNTGFLNLVETGPKPTVAAVSGIALGGGCELAIACNARVAAPGTSPRLRPCVLLAKDV